MNRWIASCLGSLALAACGGSTSADPQAQTQAQAQAQTTQAVTDGGPGPHPHHHGPPPEAIAACQGKAVGDVCSVTLHAETLAGKCSSPPDSSVIACRPDKMPEGGHGGPHGHGPPPAEVFAACDGKAAGATCSVTLDDHTMDGTCKSAPPDVTETRLGCAPAHPPQR